MAGPEGGQDLRSRALKPAEQPVSRLDTSLDRQELLRQRAAGSRRNLEAGLPLRLATSFDGLVGGSGIAGEVLCAEKKRRTPNQKNKSK